MKSKPNILVLVVALALMLTANIQAQTTNPTYLSQFPSVERVKSEIKGSDAIDTAARQQAAFWWLNQIVLAVSGSSRLVSDGDTNGIRRQYIDALQSYASGTNPRREKLSWFYQYEYPGFGDALLRQFFTPDFRAGYYRFSGKQPPQLAASQPRKATASTDGMDPDIVKAKAAKVDIRVFGMQLGDPFRLSKCPLVGIDFISENCSIEGIGLARSNTNADSEVVHIRLAPDFRPDWVAGPDLTTGSDAAVRVHDGLLVGVYVLTKARNVEKAVTAELRAKYGPASGASLGTITPDTGNPFKVSNPEWILPGIHVEYEIVQVLPDQDRVNLNNGVVRVETESTYKRRMAKRNEPVKRKM